MTNLPGPTFLEEQTVKLQMGASKNQEAGTSREGSSDQRSLNDKPLSCCQGQDWHVQVLYQETCVLGVVSKKRGQDVTSAGWYGASEKKTRLNCPIALQWGMLRP